MRDFRLLLVLTAVGAPALPGQSTRALIPVPAAFEWRSGRLALDTTFRVAVRGFADARLRRAVDRTLRRLEGRTGLTFSRPPAADSTTATLVVQADGPGMAVQGIEEDESYMLAVNEGRAELHAPTVVGVIRGLETLLQLVAADSVGLYLPAVTIQDRPRFPWRGLLIDVCRHWEPVAVIERTLDAMAAVKLNVLHWHLSELHAPTVVGVIRGLETLLQLVAADSVGLYLPAVTIQDRPRFPWRGLLIDVCRHWEPVAVIERTLDAMAAVKLNVLHWHLSED